MEAAGDEGLLKTIRPPRLEDAGLEDCALSPESIKEAFLKAASSIRTRASSILTTAEDEEDDAKSCIQDPGPSDGNLSDSLVGILPAAEPPGSCANEKGGGLPQDFGDDVVVAGVADVLSDEEDSHSDSRVVGAEIPEGGKSCVDGLQGLKIKEEDVINDRDYDERDNADEGPILTETYI